VKSRRLEKNEELSSGRSAKNRKIDCS